MLPFVLTLAFIIFSLLSRAVRTFRLLSRCQLTLGGGLRALIEFFWTVDSAPDAPRQIKRSFLRCRHQRGRRAPPHLRCPPSHFRTCHGAARSNEHLRSARLTRVNDVENALGFFNSHSVRRAASNRFSSHPSADDSCTQGSANKPVYSSPV